MFPGAPDGSPTEQIAHLLTQRLIDGVDLLIDLHSAGANFDMPLLCGYNEGDDRRGTVVATMRRRVRGALHVDPPGCSSTRPIGERGARAGRPRHLR